jgi:hypothetical protein
LQTQKNATEVAIIGAGPYGLSIAAHLEKSGIPFRIFGTPMQVWRERMPAGMFLKSEGFASSLYEPDELYTLRRYSEERGLPYQDVGHPVPLDTFIQYGLEFQRRFVPGLENTHIAALRQANDGFELRTESGETLHARRVVVAVGISNFGYVPPELESLGSDYVTHSSQHRDPAALRGRTVVVIGAGASAVDLAALMHEGGVDVSLLARRSAIAFHSPPDEPRPLLQRIFNPRSGLGVGWRSYLATEAPLLFHTLPEDVRLRTVRKHLGPAPGWFVRDKIVGHVPTHLGAELKTAVVRDGRVHLTYRHAAGESSLVADHVVAGTGYQVDLRRLPFLNENLRRNLQSIEDTPILKTNFESSVPGLYFVGLASANSFGPLTRFAYGAGFTARHLTRNLRTARKGVTLTPAVAGD